MPRPPKKKIKLNKDSLNQLMQEIYNECVELRSSAIKEINERKNQADIEDTSDIYQLGKVNNESLKIVDSVLDKKIALAKLQSTVIDTSSVGVEETSANLSDEDKEMLRELIQNKSDKDDIEYDIDM